MWFEVQRIQLGIRALHLVPTRPEHFAAVDLGPWNTARHPWPDFAAVKIATEIPSRMFCVIFEDVYHLMLGLR